MNFKVKIKNSDKKKGLTLIEVVAALAIVSIFAAFLVPKVGKYIEKAKKTRALDDVRQVVLAVEDYNISSESGKEIAEDSNFSYIKSTVGTDVVDITSIKTIKGDMTYRTMEELINGKKEFELKDGKIKITS